MHRRPRSSRMIGDVGKRAYGPVSATMFNWLLPVANRLIRRAFARSSSCPANAHLVNHASHRTARHPRHHAVHHHAVLRHAVPPCAPAGPRRTSSASNATDGSPPGRSMAPTYAGTSTPSSARSAITTRSARSPAMRSGSNAEQTPDEQQLLIAHATIERRLMARGMDYEAARTVAIAEERRQRLKST